MTLVEMLVVLAIIAGMIGLLFPAVQSSRESARKTGCLNNLNQLRIALQQYVETHKDAPSENAWTVSLLPWLEDSTTLTALQDGILDVPMPAVLECPSHPGFDMLKPSIQPSCYALVISRPEGGRKYTGPIYIVDRATDLDAGVLAPWWNGPEIGPTEFWSEQQRLKGPHRDGSYQLMAIQVGP